MLYSELCSDITSPIYISDFESKRPPFSDERKKAVELVNYEAHLVTPVFYGKTHVKVSNHDSETGGEFDPAKSHPACVGYTFVEEEKPVTPEPPPAVPDKKTCRLRELVLDNKAF